LTKNDNNNNEVTDDGDIEKIAYRFEDSGEAIAVLGVGDRFLRIIQESTDATVVARGSKVIIQGFPDEVARLENIFDKLRGVVAEGREINSEDVRLMMSQGFAAEYKEHPKEEELSLDTHQVRIRPRTKGQEKYLRSILEYPMTFCTGPAGSGRTYLAVAVAAHFLKLRRAQRVILTRPAVEAGESLGFLPGDLYDKVAPYFRPLYDALYEMLGVERTRKMIEDEVIEIAPLAYMRGRTLNKSFIILDEGQNTTVKQMKMFLTRLGFDSKAVITGDITQVDLPQHKPSGLIVVQSILKGIEGIHFLYLTEKDVVRHDLVQDIIRAYERNGNQEET